MATPFAAFVRGSGLPFCVNSKLDVSGYFNWCVLGEYDTSGSIAQKSNYASLSTAQKEFAKNKSIANAMRLFFNTNSIAYNISATGSAVDVNGSTVYDLSEALNATSSITSDLQVVERSGAFPASEQVNTSSALAPRDRSCSSGSSAFSKREKHFGGQAVVSVSARINTGTQSSDGQIVRMYNGSTSSESNFVGYGISQYWILSSRSTTDSPAIGVQSDFYTASYLQFQLETDTDEGGTTALVSQNVTAIKSSLSADAPMLLIAQAESGSTDSSLSASSSGVSTSRSSSSSSNPSSTAGSTSIGVPTINFHTYS